MQQSELLCIFPSIADHELTDGTETIQMKKQKKTHKYKTLKQTIDR